MLVTVVLVFIAVYVYAYLHGLYFELYWKRRGVKYLDRNKVFGPVIRFMREKRAMFQHFGEIYDQYPDEPAIGIGQLYSPAIFVRDPVNVQHVMANDFQSFSHRGVEVNENDYLADNVLFMNGMRWKLTRQAMTPLFTASKLKSMYYIIDRAAQDYIEYLQSNPERLQGNAYETLNTFCCAAVSAAIFGIGSDSTFKSPFLKMALEAVEPSTRNHIAFALSTFSKRLFKLTGLKFFGNHEKFFIGAIKQLIRQRQESGGKKHDFADLCVNLKNTGNLTDPETGFEVKVTDELLAGQAFFYYVAGVEPTATTIFTCLIEVGRHEQIQRKLHEDVDQLFQKYDGKLSYDAINELKYLDKVLNEAMRMYPPIGYLTRECVKDTMLPVGNIRIDKGTKVFTALFDIHHDPKYYPNPEVFDPERFEADVKTTDPIFMPFGKGNRTCVGARYAMIQVKAGLIHLLRNFQVKTIVHKHGMIYRYDQVQVRPINVDLQLIPRNKVNDNNLI